MTARVPLFAANWKMNKLPGEGEAFVRALGELLGEGLDRADLFIAPPAPMIHEVGIALAHFFPRCSLGAQNCHWLGSGAHTGEISPDLLVQLGVRYVILGHSERRILYREPDSEIALRVKAALERGINAVLCVGETKEQFEQKESKKVVLEQLRNSLADVPKETAAELILAYEPVWAIGTGLAATPEIAEEMHLAIRTEAHVLGYHPRILYGGSVTPENITAFMKITDVDGALVGGASLDPAKFAALVRAGLTTRD